LTIRVAAPHQILVATELTLARGSPLTVERDLDGDGLVDERSRVESDVAGNIVSRSYDRDGDDAPERVCRFDPGLGGDDGSNRLLARPRRRPIGEGRDCPSCPA
jgi:hypothetical protein